MKPVLRKMMPHEFKLAPGFSGNINPDGHLVVPEGYNAFTIYGPYWAMPAGFYVVAPTIKTDQVGSVGTLQICDFGIVKAEDSLRLGGALTATLPAINGLEIRIRAAGHPFLLENIYLIHISEDIAEALASTQLVVPEQIQIISQYLDGLSSMNTSSSAEFILGELFRPHEIEYVRQSIHQELVRAEIDPIVSTADFPENLKRWLDTRSAPRLVDVWGPHLAANWNLIGQLGLDPLALKLTATDHPGVAANYAFEAGFDDLAATLLTDGEDYRDATDQSDWFAALKRAQGGFMKLAACAGRAFTTCPFTGKTLSTCHSVVVPFDEAKQVAIFYKFRSSQPFYIIVCGFAGVKSFLYLPNRNIILRLSASLFEWGPPQSIVEQFYKMSLPRASILLEYFAEQTSPCVVTGTVNNLGHFFWNECSGLMSAFKAGYLNSVESACSYKYDFLDSNEIIPEFKPLHWVKFSDEAALFEEALKRRWFTLKFSGSEISTELSDRILKVAKTHSSEGELERILEARESDYLLWFGLRSHNKTWINQVEGLEAILAEISQYHGKVSLYLDGTPDCKQLADMVRERLPENVHIYPGVDVSIYDTIMWAWAVDAYVATIGSGLVAVTWLAGKPGIAHSETHHLGQMSFWGKVRTGIPLPLTPLVEEIEDRGSVDYCDYEIAPAVVQKLISGLLESQHLSDANGISPGATLEVAK